MQKFKINLIILLFSILFISCNNNSSEKQSKKLDAISFEKKISEIDNPQIIDVRTPEEFKSGHIDNARNINVNGDDFDIRVAELEKNRPVLVYCRSGARSSRAASELSSKGFEEVYDLEGGITAWKSNNFDLVSKDTKSVNNSGISKSEYQKLISQTDRLVLIDFNAEWCAPCKVLSPILKKLSEDYSEEIKLVEIDVDENELIAKDLKIQGLPTLKLYKNGEQVWQHLGSISKEDLEAIILKYS